MTKKNNRLNEWVKDNMWNLLVTTVGIIVAWTVLNQRVQALETKVAEYPSYDYFELKFRVLDEKMIEVKNAIEYHIQTQ